jgi:hypothetical protein
MPVCEADPWRKQYFENALCPPDVNIPTEDIDARNWNPRYRWVYNKILVARSQGIDAGPHGSTPPRFPVFSKPITNLRGMGIGSRVIRSPEEYIFTQTLGHMWMTLLEGRHVSSDAAVIDGTPRWWRHAFGRPAGEGTFDFWVVQANSDLEIETRCGAWISEHLSDYTGMINLETIGGSIIEVHLRFSDQWPDLYGEGWIDALVSLYHRKKWAFADLTRREGYSLVLFGPHGRQYRSPPRELIDDLLLRSGISSIQITFYGDREPAWHAMPPGGFRLAIVNCWEFDRGSLGREHLKEYFGLCQTEDRQVEFA